VRCLVVIPTLARGGAERQAVLTALALRDQGFDVRLFVQSGSTTLADEGLTGTLPIDSGPRTQSLPRQVMRLRAAVERFEPDAVITFMRGATGRFALTRAISAAARRAASIASVRGNVPLQHVARYPAAFAAQLSWYRTAQRVVVNSAALAANLFAMDLSLENKVVVVPNILPPFSTDVHVARARVDSLVGDGGRRPVIGSLGSFQVERNYMLLADSLPHVLRSRPQAHLLVIGGTSGAGYSGGASAFRARIDELGLSDHVTLAGEIPDARRLLAGLDVFALPSKLEGSSNALAEAMIAGVATATVPVADARDIVADAAVVSRGWTPRTFADAVVTALENVPTLREKALARGRALAIERSPERVGAQWAALVEEAVAARSSLRGP
jgi:glycosyltransferase involved in cell wall biosynthesis